MRCTAGRATSAKTQPLAKLEYSKIVSGEGARDLPWPKLQFLVDCEQSFIHRIFNDPCTLRNGNVLYQNPEEALLLDRPPALKAAFSLSKGARMISLSAQPNLGQVLVWKILC